VFQTLAYVSFQELATRVSHRNTGRATGCPLAEQLLARISVDENLHMVFYRNLMAAAFDLMPDAAMCAIRDEVVGFAMPGQGMPNFLRNSVTIAKAGIYDLRLHHDEVIAPVLKFWRVFERTDLGPEGEQARIELESFLVSLDAAASRFEEQRDRALRRQSAAAERRPAAS
jgi:acyl-[acyl-carrier-protein] desaturase